MPVFRSMRPWNALKKCPAIQIILFPIIGDIGWDIGSKKIIHGISKDWIVCFLELKRGIKEDWWIAVQYIFEGRLQFF